MFYSTATVCHCQYQIGQLQGSLARHPGRSCSIGPFLNRLPKVCPCLRSHNTSHTSQFHRTGCLRQSSSAKVERSTRSLLEQFRIPPVCGTLKDTQREVFLAQFHDRPLTRVASTQSHTQLSQKGPSEPLAGHPPSSDIPSHVRCLAPLDCLTFTCYVTCSVTCLVP